jgi:hypothetical protein
VADPAGRDLTARGAETRASEDNQFDRGSRFGPCGQPSVLAPSPSSGEGVVFLPGHTSHRRKGICELQLTSFGTKARAAEGVRNGSEWAIPFCVLPDHTSHSHSLSIPEKSKKRMPQLAGTFAPRVSVCAQVEDSSGQPLWLPVLRLWPSGGPVILSEAKNLHGVCPGTGTADASRRAQGGDTGRRCDTAAARALKEKWNGEGVHRTTGC